MATYLVMGCGGGTTICCGGGTILCFGMLGVRFFVVFGLGGEDLAVFDDTFIPS